MLINIVNVCSRRSEESKHPINHKQDIESYPIKHLKDDGFDLDNAEKALNNAIENRKLEIELYWKRASHFWVFIGLVWTAFGLILTQMGFFEQKPSLNDFQLSILVVVSSVGTFLSYAWVLVNKGSKFWQENWEHQIHYLEDSVIGKSYKTILSEKKGNHLQQNSYSVTKINILIAWFNFTLWALILFVATLAFFSALSHNAGIHPHLERYPSISVAIALVLFTLFMHLAIRSKSNLNGSDVIKSVRAVKDPNK